MFTEHWSHVHTGVLCIIESYTGGRNAGPPDNTGPKTLPNALHTVPGEPAAESKIRSTTTFIVNTWPEEIMRGVGGVMVVCKDLTGQPHCSGKVLIAC